MSDRPANGHWTVETLREYLLDKFASMEALFTTKLDSASDLSNLALNNSKEAVAKAEGANDKRFEGQNEWRSTINDWRTSLATRTEMEQVSQRLTDLVTRFERSEAAAVRREGDRVESRGQTNWGLGLVIIGGIQVIGVILALVNMLSKK